MPFDAIDRSAADNYNLLAGNLAITNIRLFDKTETDQAKQYFARYQLGGYRALEPRELIAMEPYANEVRMVLRQPK